jgi:hypothetical protein
LIITTINEIGERKKKQEKRMLTKKCVKIIELCMKEKTERT